jgi:hypothetical protein
MLVLVAHTCNPHYSRGLRFKASPGQIVFKALSGKGLEKRAGVGGGGRLET